MEEKAKGNKLPKKATKRLKKINDPEIKQLFKSVKTFKDTMQIRKNYEAKKLAEMKRKENEALLESQDDHGFLQPENQLEKTYKVKQADIVQNVSVRDAAKVFSLDMPHFGPYVHDVNRSGRHVLFGGRKGHLVLLDRIDKKIIKEFNVNEHVRDVRFLQNENMFAVAQLRYTYIYDRNGVEIHCLKKHSEVFGLEYLPFHFLLCSVGQGGYLKYQDISTGEMIVEHHTGLGATHVIAQNPANAIINLGHSNGTVTMWSPNLSRPHVKMLAHHGGVNAVAVDRSGTYVVTAGADGRVKVWDIRTLRELHSHASVVPTTSISISEMGVVAFAGGCHVTMYKDLFTSASAAILQQSLEQETSEKTPAGPSSSSSSSSDGSASLGEKVRLGKATLRNIRMNPHQCYMKEDIPGTAIHTVHFIPHDDVLSITHSSGYRSILVPGSGDPHFDTFDASPFVQNSQRREIDVKRLLEKIRPDMIAFTTPGQTSPIASLSAGESTNRQAEKANYLRDQLLRTKLNLAIGKKKSRGKGKAAARLKRKQANVMDLKRLELQEQIRTNKIKNNNKKTDEEIHADTEAAATRKLVPKSLDRFKPTKKH